MSTESGLSLRVEHEDNTCTRCLDPKKIGGVIEILVRRNKLVVSATCWAIFLILLSIPLASLDFNGWWSFADWWLIGQVLVATGGCFLFFFGFFYDKGNDNCTWPLPERDETLAPRDIVRVFFDCGQNDNQQSYHAHLLSLGEKIHELGPLRDHHRCPCTWENGNADWQDIRAPYLDIRMPSFRWLPWGRHVLGTITDTWSGRAWSVVGLTYATVTLLDDVDSEPKVFCLDNMSHLMCTFAHERSISDCLYGDLPPADDDQSEAGAS